MIRVAACCGDGNRGNEGMCASVVTGCDPAPVLDPSEDGLDLMALAVDFLVIVVLDLAILARRNARGGALCV